MTKNQEQKKTWQVNWTEQVEPNKINFTDVAILNNKNF